jgi:phosphatidylinositol alpha-1,6-mannosyltransferase
MDAYKGCDIFMMLSENQADGDMEGFGIAILEANYFGKPAIGSIGCGIEDAIEEGYNGFKINNKDIYATATAVSKILMSETDWATQSEAWAAKHNWNDIADDYIKLMA